jgi:hypothetical protein
MNPDATGYKNETLEKIKQKYPIIADEDLHFWEGKEKEIMEMLGYQLGLSLEELRSIIAML